MLAVSGLHDFDELSPLECASVQKSEFVDIADTVDIVDKQFRYPLFDKTNIKLKERNKSSAMVSDVKLGCPLKINTVFARFKTVHVNLAVLYIYKILDQNINRGFIKIPLD